MGFTLPCLDIQIFYYNLSYVVLFKCNVELINTCEAIFSNLEVLEASNHLLVWRESAAAFSKTVCIFASSSNGMAMLRVFAMENIKRLINCLFLLPKNLG